MRRFAVLNIVDYNNKRVAFTLPVLFSFCVISLQNSKLISNAQNKVLTAI